MDDSKLGVSTHVGAIDHAQRDHEPSLSSVVNNYEEPEPAREEDAPLVPAQGDLDWLDVASLVINKMIGSGIFTSPILVLGATRNKSYAITLWIAGFIYTLTSAAVYLEYSRELMFNGGELIYLDHVYTRRRQGPWTLFGKTLFPASRCRLLAYTIYAFYMIFIYNTTTNSMVAAEQFLIASQPEVAPENNQPLIRFIAVVVASILALLNLWSKWASLKVNKVFATYKVILLLIVIAAGGYYIAHNEPSGATSDWSHTDGSSNHWSYGLLLVLWAYSGWDNATQVAGEIPRYPDLRRGFYFGVVLVSVLYIVIAVLIGCSFSWDSGLPGEPNFAALYFGSSNYSAREAAAVLTGISAIGNINGIIYTCTRVNQSIAWSSIFPLSWYFRRSTPRHTPASGPTKESPEGGTLIHWAVTIFYIIVTTGFKDNIQEAISFGGVLQIYAHFFAQVAIGFGFAFFYRPGTNPEQIPIDREAPPAPSWFRPKFAPRLGPIMLAFFPFAFSIFTIVATPIQSNDQINGWIYIVVTFCVFGVGALYWLGLEFNVLERFGLSFEIKEHGVDVYSEPARRCEVCSQEAAHRHYVYGYMNYVARSKEVDHSHEAFDMDFSEGAQVDNAEPLSASPRQRTNTDGWTMP